MNTYARASAIGLDGNTYVQGQPLAYSAAVIQDGPVGVVFEWADPSLKQNPSTRLWYSTELRRAGSGIVSRANP